MAPTITLNCRSFHRPGPNCTRMNALVLWKWEQDLAINKSNYKRSCSIRLQPDKSATNLVSKQHSCCN